MDYTTILAKFKKRLRDETDAKWTSSEKDECLNSAAEDPAIAEYAEDRSLTASATQSYTVPTGVEKVVDIEIEAGGILYRENPANWEQKYGKIIFRNYPSRQGTMVLTVIKKFDISQDSIPTEFVNLLLALACVNAFEMLMVKFSSGFLINDVSMAELQAALAYYEKKVRIERQRSARVSNRAGTKI